MKNWICILTIGLLGISGCWSHSGLKPIYPQAMTSPVVVDSVQPTLRWKSASESNVTYDVIIYDVIKTQVTATKPRATGKVVYYREGIKESEHKIEDPLNPNTEYFWSVRFRSGEKVSAWSTWSYSFYVGGVSVEEKNAPFVFKTPEIK